MNATAALLVVVAYLLGSLSFARPSRADDHGQGHPRRKGSGNAGATNVLRAHGKGLGLAVRAARRREGRGSRSPRRAS